MDYHSNSALKPVNMSLQRPAHDSSVQRGETTGIQDYRILHDALNAISSIHAGSNELNQSDNLHQRLRKSKCFKC